MLVLWCCMNAASRLALAERCDFVLHPRACPAFCQAFLQDTTTVLAPLCSSLPLAGRSRGCAAAKRHQAGSANSGGGGGCQHTEAAGGPGDRGVCCAPCSTALAGRRQRRGEPACGGEQPGLAGGAAAGHGPAGQPCHAHAGAEPAGAAAVRGAVHPAARRLAVAVSAAAAAAAASAHPIVVPHAGGAGRCGRGGAGAWRPGRTGAAVFRKELCPCHTCPFGVAACCTATTPRFKHRLVALVASGPLHHARRPDPPPLPPPHPPSALSAAAGHL